MNLTNDNKTLTDNVERTEITRSDCRICFEKCAEVWQIFDPTNEEIPRKLMEFAAVQVEEGDGLPATICQNCRRLLDIAYNFKCQVEQSDAKFREILMLKDSNEEDDKMLALSQSVNVVITEPITKCHGGTDCADVVGEPAVSEPRHLIDRPNENYLSQNEPIIFRIEPPSEHREGFEQTSTCARSEGSEDVDEKHQGPNDLNIKGEPYDPEAMNISGDESSELDIKDCVTATIPENKHNASESMESKRSVESTIADEQEETKEELSDDEEKAHVPRTQRLKCPNCIKTFATKTSLERHAKVHKKKTNVSYVCHVCAKEFANVKKMKSHLSSSHGDSTMSDEEIGEIANDRTATNKRGVSPENGKKNMKYRCNICGKRFTYQKSFLSHAKSHTGYEVETSIEKDDNDVASSEEFNERDRESEDDDMPLEGLQCTQCGKLFATKRNLKRHLSTHSGLKFHCSMCSKEFSRLDKLKEHEQSKHKDEFFASSDTASDGETDNENQNHDGSDNRKKEKHTRPHQCPMCPKAFAQEQSLTNHMERHQRVKDTQKRFLCEVCSKCFAQSGSLVAHMRTHTGVKPYVCNVCSRAFTKSTYLQLHLRTHSGEKPYICQYCSRAFARANTLARHITMHTGEAKYHCQICMKSFRRLTSLNEHTYTHTGQRPYACKICTKRYNNAGSLYAHTKKCKAQQGSGSTTTYELPVEDEIRQNGDATPQMMIYSQRKSSDDSSIEQAEATSHFMISNVHNPSAKPLSNNIIPQFSVDDPNFCTVNTKTYKNSYYTIFPNM